MSKDAPPSAVVADVVLAYSRNHAPDRHGR
jgi:hypothetical protein